MHSAPHLQRSPSADYLALSPSPKFSRSIRSVFLHLFSTLRHTEQAEAFINSRPSSTPFFLYLSYPNAHTALFAMDSNRGRSAHGPFGDNVEEMDWSIGRVLDLLEARGERDDTLVYFASDNGPFREELEEGGYCGHAPLLTASTPLVTSTTAGWNQPFARAAAPLRGAKAQTWDCGLRVPSILSYPSRWSGGLAIHLATSNMDVLPTVLALTEGGSHGFSHVSELGASAMAGPRVLDGRSLVPMLDGLTAARRLGDEQEAKHIGDLRPTEVHDFIFHYCAARVSSARHGVWKVHYTTTKWEDEAGQMCRQNVICNCHGHEHDPPLLYNVHEDPAETTPLDTSLPAHAATLRTFRTAVSRHEATLVSMPSQTELLPTLRHFPCCGVERGTWSHVWQVINNLCGC